MDEMENKKTTKFDWLCLSECPMGIVKNYLSDYNHKSIVRLSLPMTQ